MSKLGQLVSCEHRKCKVLNSDGEDTEQDLRGKLAAVKTSEGVIRYMVSSDRIDYTNVHRRFEITEQRHLDDSNAVPNKTLRLKHAMSSKFINCTVPRKNRS